MALRAGNSVVLAVVALVACGGRVAPSTDEAGAQRREGGGASPLPTTTSAGSPTTAAPLPTTIPTGPARAAGAVGTKRCTPLDQPSPIHATTPTKPVLVGRAWNNMVYVVDDDPERPGHHRAFIHHGFVFERHALSEDDSKPDTFIIDRGLPNQIMLTRTSLQGAGEDGPLSPPDPDQMAIFHGYANDAPESLAYAPNPLPFGPDAKQFFVVAPVIGGVLGVPRIFYGPSDAIRERTFLGFDPPDSNAKATAATSVIFDLDGTPTTLPTIVTRETQGLINGFGSSYLAFFCF